MTHLYSTTALTRALATAGFACALFACAEAAAADQKPKPAGSSEVTISNAELVRRLDALAAQNALLQQKVERLEAGQAQQSVLVQQQAVQVQQQAQAVEKVQQDVSVATASNTGNSGNATTVGGYGEIGYSHPTKSAKDSSVDVQRAVIALQHRFDDKTKVVGEFEFEHAVTSAGDKGEAEVEQLYVEREFGAGLRGRAGLFLMPVGLVNQNHEPTAYYGVFRPDVDTKIIPSTWREVGVGLSATTAQALTWDVALSTMPNLSKWNASSTEGRVRGPLQAIHGEGQFAAARDLGLVGALNWRGVPGLLLGGSVVYGGIGQQQTALANNAKLLMLDGHARYQINGWDFAGEVARGTISNTEARNASFSASSITNPTLIPHLFWGGYVQAAYRLWHQDDYTLSPFVRYEVFNTSAGFGGLSIASGGVKAPTERLWTVGASLLIGEGVVVKADYRRYKQNTLPDVEEHFTPGNSFNVGVGFSF